MQEYEFHEVADIFPLMEGDAFKRFGDDIEQNGLENPIAIYQGKILDGRNRYRICKERGIQLRTVKVSPADPVQYSVSQNLHRRQLTNSQRAIVGARIYPHFAEQAKKAMAEGGKVGGKLAGVGRPKQIGVSAKADTPKKRRGVASHQVGELLGISGDSVDRGRQVLESGSERMIQSVEKGDLSVTAAARVSEKHPKKRQNELLSEGSKKVTEESSKIAARAKGTKAKKKPLPKRIEEHLKFVGWLIGQVEKSEKGTPTERKRAIAMLREHSKYIKACANII